MFLKGWPYHLEKVRTDPFETTELDETPRCIKCGSADIGWIHHGGSFDAPECTYWECTECGHQWGHE